MKRFLSTALALLMTFSVVTGCSNNANETTSETSSGTTSVAETTDKPQETTALDVDEIRGNTSPSQELAQAVNSTINSDYLGNLYETKIPNDYSKYPYKSDVTLEIWQPMNGSIASGMKDLNEHPVYVIAQELTGINVKVVSPPIGQENEQFNTMVAAADLPDIIIDQRYPGGLVAGVNDGLFEDLTDIVDNGAPNYTAFRNSNETIRKATLTDDRRIVGFNGISPYPEWMWFGMLIKQEALDKTGLAVPETIDEWYNFFKKCKEVGYGEPLNYGSNYGQIFTGCLNSAYGVYDWTYNDNGTVKWGPAAPKAKEYLEMMRQWQSEGLLNSDWITADFNQRMAKAVSDDCAVMMDSPDTMWSFWKVDNGIDYIGAVNPVLNKGDKSTTTYHNFYVTGTTGAITTQCKDVDAALAWLDFGYTQKGWELYNFGTYGSVHLVDAEGSPYYSSDSILYTDTKLPVNDRIWTDRIHVGANIRDEHYSNPLIVQEGSYSGGIRELWTDGMDASVAMPPVTLEPDEVSEEANLGTQLSTLRGEYFTKIILGQLPIDAYDEFLAKAQQIGLDRFLEIWQGALDRYNAR